MRHRLPYLSDYFAQIERLNLDGRLIHYPGSPQLIAQLLRPQDRALLMEREAESYQLLTDSINDERIESELCDSWERLAEISIASRSLLLIDPPYVHQSDYDQAELTVRRLITSHPDIRILLWYPQLTGGVERSNAMRQQLLPVECRVVEWHGLEQDGLHGCGVVLFGSGWDYEQLNDQLTSLAEALATHRGERAELLWY